MEGNNLLKKLADERLQTIRVASYILSELSLCPYNEVQTIQTEVAGIPISLSKERKGITSDER